MMMMMLIILRRYNNAATDNNDILLYKYIEREKDFYCKREHNSIWSRENAEGSTYKTKGKTN